MEDKRGDWEKHPKKETGLALAKRALTRSEVLPNGRGIKLVLSLLVLALVLSAGYLLIFDIDNWMGWQHVIGAFGGLILAFLLCVLILMWVDLDAGPLFTILAVTAANFLLCVFFRENYRIIFIWMSAYLILSSTASSVIYLSDEEKAWGIAQICVTVLAAAALALGLVFF